MSTRLKLSDALTEALPQLSPEEQRKYAEIKGTAGPEPAAEPTRKTEPKKEKSSLIIPSLLPLSEVQPEEVSFLWDPYIPLGKLTLLEGDPGLGKTFLSLNICTAISKGWPLPGVDGRPGDALKLGNVLFMSAEDAPADTLAPRLEKMGADRSRIILLTGWKVDETEEEDRTFTLQDANVLRAALEQVKPALVVVDPLQGYIGAIDFHRANETRPVLSALGKLADEFQCAVLAIRHLSKGNGKALYRGLGSIDFTAAARSVMLVGQDPDSGKKALVHVKSSCAQNGPALGFEIDNDLGFVWSGLSDATADDLLANPMPPENRRDTLLEDVKTCLREVLAEGIVKADVVLSDVKQETGAGTRTIYAAKSELGVKSERRRDGWYWYIPASSVQNPDEHCTQLQPCNLATLEETPVNSHIEQTLQHCNIASVCNVEPDKTERR